MKIIYIKPTEINTVAQLMTGGIERLILRVKFTSQIMGIFHLLMKNPETAVARWDMKLLL